ncbi:SRPBCC family protein [Kineobactrum salinum]|uniref:SRPBCC family protein n=1 Tax=Kineobactrum salinum TaxID=2708301 RepID=A0A6C0U450_9GAMM|nr:SRPBCC family protein [Kineobactrum salinum]QIB66920.1 SRPBCC family protein [Kineobactrum salinum]
MRDDFTAYLGAVSRTVTELEREGKPARNVTLERIYDTSPDDLWEAVTNPERLTRWFLPVSGDLKPGGHFQLKGNAGGTIRECDPPGFLSITWEFGGGMSWVEVRIAAESESRARLTLSHICPVDDHWKKYGPGAVGVGWDLALLALVFHFVDGAEQLDEATFSASSEGKAYITGASGDWRQAAVASGDDAAHAEAAAERTTAFYTGTLSPDS